VNKKDPPTGRRSMAKLTTIEGIGVTVEKKLKKAGVGSTHSLLKLGGTKKGRKELAVASKMDEGKLLRFVNHADLMRIRGIGGEFSELLEAAGVDSVPELKRRNPANLRAAMEAANAKRKKKLVRQLPSEKQVASWVEQAKKLDRAVSH
jgi:predicted flap endonuclease-1-like 5' DNA nuclease